MRMLVHDGDQTFKVQIPKIYKQEERIINLQAKVTENHKEMIAHPKNLKHIIEGMEESK